MKSHKINKVKVTKALNRNKKGVIKKPYRKKNIEQEQRQEWIKSLINNDTSTLR